MGEQTQRQIHEQPPQPQPQTQSHVKNQPSLSTITSRSDIISILQPTAASPSKLPPSRPLKLRKLSPESAVTSTSTPTPSDTPYSTPKPQTKIPQSRTLTTPPPRVVAKSLSSEGQVDKAIHHLRNADPLMSSLIDLHPLPTFDIFHTPFLALTRGILYQQLAFKAGSSTYTRFISLCGGEASVVPDTVLALTPQQLRQIGVSGRKASYLHDLARKYHSGILSDSIILNLDDKSLFTLLTMVNGIGSWSVHMFMIFSLHRPDVLPINDLGIRKGVQLLYSLDDLPRPSQMDQLCEKWRPYRSVASWYLWRFVEGKGSPSSAVAVATAASLMQQPQEEQQQPQLIDPINGILDLGAYSLMLKTIILEFTIIGRVQMIFGNSINGPVHGDNDQVRA